MKRRGEFEYCESCGGTEILQHSHLVPRSFNKKLTTNPMNIICQCQKCHSEYEARNIEKMKQFQNYNQILNTLRFLDFKFFQIIKDKIEKYEQRQQK